MASRGVTWREATEPGVLLATADHIFDHELVRDICFAPFRGAIINTMGCSQSQKMDQNDQMAIHFSMLTKWMLNGSNFIVDNKL